MRKVYFLFGSVVLLTLSDLFLTSRATETIHVIIMMAMLLLFLVCLAMVLFSKGRAWTWKIGIVVSALLLMTLYFKTVKKRSIAAFNIAFYMHHQGFKDFAVMLNHKSDSIVLQLKSNGSQHVFNTDVFDPLTKDPQVKEMQKRLGIRSFFMLDIKSSDSTIEGKYVPEITLLNESLIMGIQYNPSDVKTEESTWGYRNVWRHDDEWQFWSASGGGFGVPM